MLIAISVCMLSILASCSIEGYGIKGVAYQSVQQKEANINQTIPETAQIVVMCYIDTNGFVDVRVNNNTDRMMTIDRTKSFFTNKGMVSQAYYDPTIRTTVTSNTVAQQKGVSANLGTIANAVGVGGVVGNVLNGVNVSGGQGVASTTTNSSVFIDQPQVTIPSKGTISMGNQFQMVGIGNEFLETLIASGQQAVNGKYTLQDTYASVNIVITYSLENETTTKQIETTLYANSCIMNPVIEKGMVNQALRSIYQNKPDAYDEPWYLFRFGEERSNFKERSYLKPSQLMFINYK